MKRVQQALKMIEAGIKGKRVLEVACGCGEFSIKAASIANEVQCIDLDSFRLLSEIENHSNIIFKKMDATKMTYEDGYFDSCVVYNAIGHLSNSLEKIIEECIRVTSHNGNIYIISSFKMDKRVINDKLIPLLQSQNMDYSLREKLPFICVTIKR